MSFAISCFAERFAGASGTRLLMDDLGEALASGQHWCNLGGGNPAAIPAVQAAFHAALSEQLADGRFDRLAASYDGPQGHLPLRRAFAAMLEARYGWPVGPEHVALTAGSQHSFFMLFNAFSGRFPDGSERRLDLPLAPEYIGYGDIALTPEAVRSVRPAIEFLPGQQFKYRVDFARFRLAPDTGAVCLSRPTNPTGNVLSADELTTLVELTAAHGVPLIIDNAYGPPFPDIVFGAAEPVFAAHVINCFSLSKLGLAGLRSGIVVAQPEVIDLLRSLNASMILANNSLAASLVTPLLESGVVASLTRDVIRPFYRARVEQALAWCQREFAGLDYFIHKPEGAIFLWLWFRGLPIGSAELYGRLKARGVLVIPGHHFFPGLPPGWAHTSECLRISYAQAEREVEAGIRAIGEEVRAAFAGQP